MSGAAEARREAGASDGKVATSSAAGIDRALAGVAIVVVLGAFMSILDTTVVNVAIETLGRDLSASLATVQWVATGYLLALATTIPLAGWAADRFGAARLFVTAVVAFMAGSALAGAAPSVGALIAFRVLQGLGGGLILPAGITLVGQAAGPERMGRVMSAIGVPMLLAPVVGPLLGGWLVDTVSWRWIFFVNVPVGVVVLLLAARLLPREGVATSPASRRATDRSSAPASRRATNRPSAPASRRAPDRRASNGARPRPEPLDRISVALLSPGLAALVYGLSAVSSAGGVGSARVVVPLVGGVLLIALFTRHALRRTSPLLELRLLRVPSVAASTATLTLLGGAYLGALFLLPLYLQGVRGESAFHTGLLLIPQGASAAVTIFFAGRATDRVGPHRVVLAGLIPFALALALLTRLRPSTSVPLLEAILVLFGIGMGATMMPAMTAAYRPLKRAQVARATALLTIVQRVGSSLGVALVAVVLGTQPASAADFGGAFAWPLALVLTAFAPAALLSRGGAPPAPLDTPETRKAAAEESATAS
ncbi:MAG TPA: MFS transporter [Conexibacter sp.]|jgi:MFS family permease